MTSFLELHVPGSPLLIPNPWDTGSARLLAALGFRALATTSSGFAASIGRLDYGITRDEALEHAALIVAATDLPVSADLENGFGDDPAVVAETIRLACETGLAGASIEDSTGREDDPIYDAGLAVERIAAAVEAAGDDFVLTARAENYLHGRPDLDDTVARLHSFERAGAHVLYAPGPTDAETLRAIVDAVGRPVNVLARPGCPSVAELGDLGVARVSVGGSFAFAAYGELVRAGRELLDQGSYGYAELSGQGAKAVREAFG